MSGLLIAIIAVFVALFVLVAVWSRMRRQVGGGWA
jgi:hypothetical protein